MATFYREAVANIVAEDMMGRASNIITLGLWDYMMFAIFLFGCFVLISKIVKFMLFAIKKLRGVNNGYKQNIIG